MKKSLRDLRKERNLTQQGLADALGVNIRTEQRWEYGQANISRHSRKMILMFFGVKDDEVDF